MCVYNPGCIKDLKDDKVVRHLFKRLVDTFVSIEKFKFCRLNYTIYKVIIQATNRQTTFVMYITKD